MRTFISATCLALTLTACSSDGGSDEEQAPEETSAPAQAGMAEACRRWVEEVPSGQSRRAYRAAADLAGELAESTDPYVVASFLFVEDVARESAASVGGSGYAEAAAVYDLAIQSLGVKCEKEGVRDVVPSDA